MGGLVVHPCGNRKRATWQQLPARCIVRTFARTAVPCESPPLVLIHNFGRHKSYWVKWSTSDIPFFQSSRFCGSEQMLSLGIPHVYTGYEICKFKSARFFPFTLPQFYATLVPSNTTKCSTAQSPRLLSNKVR